MSFFFNSLAINWPVIGGCGETISIVRDNIVKLQNKGNTKAGTH